MKSKEFNIVILGTGGQGLITLLQILAEAAFIEGYSVRTSELHGLSQRGGSVEVHIRFGKEINSPLVAQGKANLVLGLEMQEALKGAFFAGSKTKFLLNKQITPIPQTKSLSEKEIVSGLKKVSNNVKVVDAAEICGNAVASGVYLISLAAVKNIIPIEPDSILKAIKKTIPKKHLELNLKTFRLAQG